jgi:hypothetical protein
MNTKIFNIDTSIIVKEDAIEIMRQLKKKFDFDAWILEQRELKMNKILSNVNSKRCK